MKKIIFALMVVAMAAATLTANAQFGMKFGYVSQSSKFKNDDDSTFKPKAQSGVYVGFSYDIATAVTGLSVRPGLVYTYVGGKSLMAEELAYELDVNANRIKDRSHSVAVPIDLKYAYNVSDDFKIYAFAGPRLDVGLFYQATMKYEGVKGSVDLYSGKIKAKDSDGNEVSETMEDGGIASRFDIQLGLGAGLQYKKVALEVGYDFGMLNRLKSEYSDDVTLKMSKFVIGLGFAF
ncbi:MAG: PorT family protein [Alistipes sp.]|jgi:hypothetical protein|nr:PorT family protein [Alistipes sp.]